MTIDSVPPVLNLATFVPFEGERAGVGDALFASLRFNEPVTVVHDGIDIDATTEDLVAAISPWKRADTSIFSRNREPTPNQSISGKVPSPQIWTPALQGSTSSHRSPMTGRATAIKVTRLKPS